MKKHRLKRHLALLMVLVMAFSLLPVSPALAAPEGTVEIPETYFDNIKKYNGTVYDTFYYTEGEMFSYKTESVTFVNESTISANGTTYALKNKKIDAPSVAVTDDTATITFSELTTPINQISGQWNSQKGNGSERGISYAYGIPAEAEITSERWVGTPSVLKITGLADGEYLLTGGSIYEKANQYSPGTNLGHGIVTEGFFGRLPDISFTVGAAEDPIPVPDPDPEPNPNPEPITGAVVPDDFENDLWLQYGFKQLAVGETTNIYPRRVPQAVSNLITNDVQRPNFNFDIIQGDSVSITPVVSGGKNNSANITAVKPGVTIVKVTYDEFKHTNVAVPFGAVSDVNIAYAIYYVTDGAESGITVDFNDTLTSYDTVYFAEGDYANYNISPIITGADNVTVTCNGNPVTGNSDVYTLPLENRSNIIGIHATKTTGEETYYYRVIDARKIEINITNTTNPGQPLEAGNKAKISFRGITIPVYKLATIYNPILGSSSYVEYTNAALGTFRGKSAQYNLATQNSFDVTFADSGDFLFTGGRIHESWYGDALGSDKGSEGQGEPNLNAPTNASYFSIMPDFTVTVNGAQNRAVEGVTIDQNDLSLVINTTAALSATVTPSDASDKNVTWSSSNNDVASVASNGTVTAKSVGYAAITVTTEDGGFTASITVTVTPELPATEAQRKALGDLILSVKALKEAEYSPETWSALQAELQTAESVYADSDALAADVNKAHTDLTTAKSMLVKTGMVLDITVSPEPAYVGATVSVSLTDLELPTPEGSYLKELYTIFSTDIPGLATVTSANARSNSELLRTLEFEIPEGTAPGEYTLYGGYVQSTSGVNPQPPFDGMYNVKYYQGLMPNIKITVEAETGPETVTVRFWVYGPDYSFIMMDSEITVTEGTAENYGWHNAAPDSMLGGNDHGVYDGEITVLDALFTAHETYYGNTEFTASNFTSKMGSSATYLSKIFGKSGAISFAVNDRPAIGTMSDGYGVNECVLQDGDVVYFFFYQDEDYGMFDHYAFFDRQAVAVEAGESFTLNAKEYPFTEQLWGSPGFATLPLTIQNAPGLGIFIVDANGEFVEMIGETDDDGNVTLSFDEPGTYLIATVGEAEDTYFYVMPVVPAWCIVTVTEPVITTYYTVTLATGDTAINAGETFTADVIVSGAGSIGGLEATIGFNDAVTFVSAATATGAVIASTHGEETAHIVLTHSGGIATDSGITVATLTFRAKTDISSEARAEIAVTTAEYSKNGDRNDYTATIGDPVSRTLYNLTVTFTGGGDVTMTDATAFAKYGEAGLYTSNDYQTPFTFPSVTANAGYLLTSPLLWNDGTNDYTELDITAISFSENSAFTVQTIHVGDVSFIEFDEYLGAPTGYKVMLFTPAGDKTDSAAYLFDGEAMFWSDKYPPITETGAFAFMVEEDMTVEEALALITIDTNGPANTSIKYNSDVNGNGRPNVSDALIAHDLYGGNADYLTDDSFIKLPMLMRFEADVNGDGKVDLQDVQLIQTVILGI